MRLIDADALIKKAQEREDMAASEFGLKADKVKEIRIEDIEKAPTVDPVDYAYWKPMNKNDKGLVNVFKCSKCKTTIQAPFWTDNFSYRYCPMCGASMKGKQNESTN